jgi:hypothetical protein
MDVDFLLHDAHGPRGPRFLVFEFKRDGITGGQAWALENLRRRAGVEVALVDESRYPDLTIQLPPFSGGSSWRSLDAQTLDWIVHQWLVNKRALRELVELRLPLLPHPAGAGAEGGESD